MGIKKLKGSIIINAFKRPVQSVLQAERLQAELRLFGAETDIVTDGFLQTELCGRRLFSRLKDRDFIVYLDKDKYLSAILDKLGVRLFNTHGAIRICDDKGETYIKLCGEEDIVVPRTVFAPICYDGSDKFADGTAEKIAEKLGFPVIVKESYGSMGKGVHKADNIEELRALTEALKTRPHMYQQCIGERGRDIRIIVIGGKAVAAMERVNERDFRSNIALGGRGRAIDLNAEAYAEFKKQAQKAAEIIGLDYCGIDFLSDGGKPVLCEVNSNAFFGEMEKVTGINVARLYAKHITDAING